MASAAELLQQIGNPRLTRSERAHLRCQLARAWETSGNFDAARNAMGDLWGRVGERPRVEELEVSAQAAVLLRAGTLTGHLGSMQQLTRAQETAKDLIGEALDLYERIGDSRHAAEARVEMAWCYWREGALDEARVMLVNATLRLTGAEDRELRALALIRRAIVEKEAMKLSDASRILAEAAPLLENLDGRHSLGGTYHNALAMVLRSLGEIENREEYFDRALIEYAAASYHFEQAGDTRYRAAVENNIGYLYFKADRLDKAREHLDRAHRLFESVRDAGRTAVVDETRARLLLAENRNFKAERLARTAVNVLSRGGEQARLIEALTTHGVALARLGQVTNARRTLERAVGLGEQIGDAEGAGRAALTLIEELDAALGPDEVREIYERADAMLSRDGAAPPHAETAERLRKCARAIIRRARQSGDQAASSSAKVAYLAAAGGPSVPARGAFVHAARRTAEMLAQAERAAQTDVTILISGETGTGKEILAAQIHRWSKRRGPLVTVNCAALNENLIESEVFGHRKGSFTDAVQDYAGAAKRAAGGTLFLDEVGELSPVNQAKLLRLLENKEIKAIGSETSEQIDVRIVAATNRRLRDSVRAGDFRLDLYHRLCVFELEILPLRERTADIRPLAEHFLAAAVKRYARRVALTEDAFAALAQLELRGNARELRSLIERTVILARDEDVVQAPTLRSLAAPPSPPRQRPSPPPAEDAEVGDDEWSGCSLPGEVRAYEKKLIRRALEKSGGSVTEAARRLGVSHQALVKKINAVHRDLLAVRKQPRRRGIIGK